jgi:hypothetical protein
MTCYALPAPKLATARKPQLLQYVGYVILDSVYADAAAQRYFTAAHAVAHGFYDPPFGGSEKVFMPWPTAFSSN